MGANNRVARKVVNVASVHHLEAQIEEMAKKSENNVKNMNEKEIEELKDIVFDFFCIIEDNLAEFIKKEKEQS